MNASYASCLEQVAQKYEYEFESLDIDGQKLEVLSLLNMPAHINKLLHGGALRNPIRDLPLWSKIWPGSIILGRFLRKFAPEGKSMLELGAGMGICSLVAARHGFASIVASDANADAIACARVNIARNELGHTVTATHLDLLRPTFGPERLFDLIAASELLYLDELHRPLLKFLRKHLAPGGQAFFCTDMARLKPRFQKLASREYHVAEARVGLRETGDSGREERHLYSILKLERQE